jgi:hypothetical protein
LANLQAWLETATLRCHILELTAEREEIIHQALKQYLSTIKWDVFDQPTAILQQIYILQSERRATAIWEWHLQNTIPQWLVNGRQLPEFFTGLIAKATDDWVSSRCRHRYAKRSLGAYNRAEKVFN